LGRLLTKLLMFRGGARKLGAVEAFDGGRWGPGRSGVVAGAEWVVITGAGAVGVLTLGS